MGKKQAGIITDEVRELINEVARATASRFGGRASFPDNGVD